MITSPYNFVPLSSDVFPAPDAELISMDIPFSDGEDGIIELSITSHSPLFVRNGHKREAEDYYSAHIEMPDGSKKYYIPATSVKGCIRNVLEIISAAKMVTYNNDSFGWQRPFGEAQKALRYRDLMKNVNCGWLYIVKEQYFITPCNNGIQPIHHSDIIRKYFSDFNEGTDNESSENKQRSVAYKDELFPLLEIKTGEISYKENKNIKYVPQGFYRIVCTGYMKGKKHEYLFSENQGKCFEVSYDDFIAFESIHKGNKSYGEEGKEGYLRKALYAGKRIPVFFIKDNDSVKIGLTRYMRFPFANNVKQAVENAQKPTDSLDIPEAIFGYTCKENSLRGRVHIGHAWCEDFIDEHELTTIEGVLGQPKASFYPFYLKQSNAPYKTYDTDGVKIAGRKRYRIFESNKTRPLPRNEKNQNVEMPKSFALPHGKKFKCYLSVHNMRPFEIGALLSAISFNLTDGTFHNIGLAKSFGYGKISMQVTRLNGLKLDIQEYLHLFEVELAKEGFSLKTLANALVKIASEHLVDEVRMMEMEHKIGNKKEDEYKNAKSNNNFSVLEESSLLTINCSLDNIAVDRIRRENERVKAQAIQEQIEKEFAISTAKEQIKKNIEWAKAQISSQKALEYYSNALSLSQQYSLPCDEIQLLIKSLEQEKQKATNTPLSVSLEGKNSSLGSVAAAVKNWIHNGNEMSDDNLMVLVTHIATLPEKMHSDRELNKQMKAFVKAMGKEWTDKLYEKLKGLQK
ncbi:TIGR03986 family CRISPR-associated RAMP protein [Sodaliphilus sp.]|uniref:TIGR03986 family type III CRISPR-associated RAMP protein n=1 Tax=Sodaliphilus sp. TaxID=2815818 RepID=UPI00388EA003